MSRDLQSSFVEPTEMTRDSSTSRRWSRRAIDIVGVGRTLLMDPDWIEKLRSREALRLFRLKA